MNQDIAPRNFDQLTGYVISFLKDETVASISERRVNFIRELFSVGETDPQLVRCILDRIYQGRDLVPIQFYEVRLSSEEELLRLFRPAEVCPVYFDTINLTKVVREYALNGKKTILDVGCGCGLTSIAVCDPSRTVVALDISKLAIMTAKLNASWNGVSQYIQFVHSDFSDYGPNQKFDIIVSNPPLTPFPVGQTEAAQKMYDSLRRGELDIEASKLAIYYYADSGGHNLLDLIFQKAPTMLREGGVIVVAVGGNFLGDMLGVVTYVGRKYGFPDPEVRWFRHNFSEEKENYPEGPVIDERFIKIAVRDGVKVYADPDMRVLVKDPKEIQGINYYFKGLVAIFQNQKRSGQ